MPELTVEERLASMEKTLARIVEHLWPPPPFPYYHYRNKYLGGPLHGVRVEVDDQTLHEIKILFMKPPRAGLMDEDDSLVPAVYSAITCLYRKQKYGDRGRMGWLWQYKGTL